MKSDQMYGQSLINALMLGNLADQLILQKYMIIHGKKSQLNKKKEDNKNI